jgi:hypothetical protein
MHNVNASLATLIIKLRQEILMDRAHLLNQHYVLLFP